MNLRQLLFPFQEEINRAASRVLENQAQMGEDQILIPPGRMLGLSEMLEQYPLRGDYVTGEVTPGVYTVPTAGNYQVTLPDGERVNRRLLDGETFNVDELARHETLSTATLRERDRDRSRRREIERAERREVIARTRNDYREAERQRRRISELQSQMVENPAQVLRETTGERWADEVGSFWGRVDGAQPSNRGVVSYTFSSYSDLDRVDWAAEINCLLNQYEREQGHPPNRIIMSPRGVHLLARQVGSTYRSGGADGVVSEFGGVPVQSEVGCGDGSIYVTFVENDVEARNLLPPRQSRMRQGTLFGYGVDTGYGQHRRAYEEHRRAYEEHRRSITPHPAPSLEFDFNAVQTGRTPDMPTTSNPSIEAAVTAVDTAARTVTVSTRNRRTSRGSETPMQTPIGRVHYKRREGWTRSDRADPGMDYTVHIVVPEQVPPVATGFATANLMNQTVERESIRTINFELVREVTTRNLRTGEAKRDLFYEEI